MSSIRLFILSSFAEHGAMHGHKLRILADHSRVHLWTDISVGAVYGAMKRLAAEGLLRETSREKAGNRPTRQIYEITESGRSMLAAIRRSELSSIWFKYDPFDLAITRARPDLLEDLPVILRDRLVELTKMLAEAETVNAEAKLRVGIAKQWALRHTEYRLRAEIEYFSDILENVNDLIAGEMDQQ